MKEVGASSHFTFAKSSHFTNAMLMSGITWNMSGTQEMLKYLWGNYWANSQVAVHIQWLYSCSSSSTTPLYFEIAEGWAGMAKEAQISTINTGWFRSRVKNVWAHEGRRSGNDYLSEKNDCLVIHLQSYLQSCSLAGLLCQNYAGHMPGGKVGREKGNPLSSSIYSTLATILRRRDFYPQVTKGN